MQIAQDKTLYIKEKVLAIIYMKPILDDLVTKGMMTAQAVQEALNTQFMTLVSPLVEVGQFLHLERWAPTMPSYTFWMELFYLHYTDANIPRRLLTRSPTRASCKPLPTRIGMPILGPRRTLVWMLSRPGWKRMRSSTLTPLETSRRRRNGL
jgi:hypothetical protein